MNNQLKKVAEFLFVLLNNTFSNEGKFCILSIAPYQLPPLKGCFFVKHFFDKYKKSILFPGIGGAILCFFLLFNQGEEQPPSLMQPITLPEQIQLQDEQVENVESTPTKQMEIVVDVKGAVKAPGVYTLMLDDRVIDAITIAGGYTAEADPTHINHAQKVIDEMVIYVPKKGEDISVEQMTIVSSPSANSQASSGKVNLNAATESDLTTLPGIGPAKAKAILEYRQQNGRFKSVDDLKNVSGIGEKTFEKLKQYIEI